MTGGKKIRFNQNSNYRIPTGEVILGDAPEEGAGVGIVERSLAYERAGSMSSVPPSPFLDEVVCGDSAEVLKMIPNESVNTVITSPPYFQQRDYNGTQGIGSESTVDEYVNDLMRTFRECARVVRSDGSIFFNVGDKYEDGSLLFVPYAFAKRATQETGLKIINQITWVKPNPQPRQFKRRLVSATEPIFHFVKSDSYKYYPDRFGEGLQALRPKKSYSNGNIGQSYFDLIKSSQLTATEKARARRELEEAIREVKEGKIWSFRMKVRGIHSAAYGGYEGGRKLHIESKGFTIIRMFDRPMKRDVIDTPIIPDKFLHHPAVFPSVLVRECLNLTTEPGDLVLDPFLGSGTTAVVAKEMTRHYIGIEIDPSYCKSARKRIDQTMAQKGLFEFVV